MPAEAAVVGSLDRLEDSFPRWRIHVAGKLASQCKPLAGELSSPPHGPLHRAIGVSSQCSCWIPPEQMISLRRMPWCLLRLSFRSLTPSFHDIVLATQVSCAQLGKGLLLKRCDYQEARISGAHHGSWLPWRWKAETKFAFSSTSKEKEKLLKVRVSVSRKNSNQADL